MFGLFKRQRDPNEKLEWFSVFFNVSQVTGGPIMAAAATGRIKSLLEKMRCDYEKEGKKTTPLTATIGSVYFEVEDYPSDINYMVGRRDFKATKAVFNKLGCDLTVAPKPKREGVLDGG